MNFNNEQATKSNQINVFGCLPGPCRLRGGSKRALEASCGHLGDSWGVLGRPGLVLNRLGAVLGRLGGVLGPYWAFGRLGVVLGVVLEPSSRLGGQSRMVEVVLEWSRMVEDAPARRNARRQGEDFDFDH